MRFSVRHETLYRYSTPVVLAPHVVRLNPQVAGGLLRERSLLVHPPPVRVWDEPDPYGNQVTRLEFADQATSLLRIESRFALDTLGPAATEESPHPLPWYARTDHLSPFASVGPGWVPAVDAFAHQLAAETGYRPLAFLDHLCRTIYARADRHIRTDGDAQSPTETLTSWRGACRDFTVLFMAAARTLGMPARFCSGYQAAAETPDGRHYLHAWPEVHLPGIGWRGWDPTHGIPVGAGHVALCAAPEQAGTMPIEGGYYFTGERLTSTLDFILEIGTA